ncbi:LysM domain-containing protein [Gammaproteobacteria bacterium]
MFIKKLLGIILFSTLLASTGAETAENTPELNPQHPDRYVVVPGDTLWDIAGRFLTHPWHWKDLWSRNPQIENPHLIYPGDVISIYLVNGRLVTGLTRGGATLKLSPTIRESSLVQSIPTIPLDAIQPFLNRARVTSVSEMKSAAYVIGQAERRLASVTGDHLYARGIASDPPTRYGIYRAGRPYYRKMGTDDPLLLGFEAISLGEAELTRPGDPATLLVTQSSSEILSGDRLLPEESQVFNRNFMPHAPDFPVEARIIDVMGGLSRVARLQTVVIDRGLEDGLEVGHVLVINQSGAMIQDPVTKESIMLPEERAGLLMVFRVFDRVSYALVLEAQQEMQLFAVVRTPQP